MKQKKRFIKNRMLAKATSNREDTIDEFLTAYSILTEACLFAERKQGYLRLYKNIIPESSPPTNINYLKHKIALDKYLSRATSKIYRILGLK